MNIGETLRFFRDKNHMKQKELLSKNFDSSAYSRIENGKQSIRIDKLEELLETLSVSTEEFFLRASFNDQQKKFRSLYFYCATHLNNQTQKKKLLKYYVSIQQTEKNLRALSNYIAIKNYFSQFWNEVTPLSTSEIENIYQYLISKDYYQQFDYIIISNMIQLFNEKYQKFLVGKALPMVDEDLRDSTTKKYAYNIVINLISSQIYKKNYLQASKYLELAKKQDKTVVDYRYRLHIQYLDNLINYLMIGDYRFLEKIHHFIHILDDIGDVAQSKAIQDEIKHVTHKNFDFSTSNSYPVAPLKI